MTDVGSRSPLSVCLSVVSEKDLSDTRSRSSMTDPSLALCIAKQIVPGFIQKKEEEDGEGE